MTAATSPTADALARLAKIQPAPSWSPGSELEPWLAAADAGGFELPIPALAVIAEAAHLAEEAAANVRPGPHRSGDVERILRGASVDEVIGADAAHAAAVALHSERERLIVAAGRVMQGHVAAAFLRVRDDLITGPLRTSISELLAEASEVAHKLRKYAPEYGPSLLESGTTSELNAWRTSLDLNARFAKLVSAWLTSWGRATGRGMDTDRGFRPQRAGGYYAWTEPDAVPDEAVRYGYDMDVLRIAAAPSACRLLAPSELAPLLVAIDAGLDPKDERHPASWIVKRGVVASGA